MGADSPQTPQIKNSNISDFGEIWTIYVNLDEKSNEIGQNYLDGHVRELWGVAAPLNPF